MDDKTTPTRRERERESHRQEILDAAEEIFAEKGFGDATLEDIAKKADFAVGTIYNFFNGKNDLVNNVLVRLVKTRVAEIEKNILPKIAEPLTALRMLTDMWVEHHIRHGAFIRVAIIARMIEGKTDWNNAEDAELRDLHEIYSEMNTRVFEAGIKAGVFHKMKAEHAFTIFEGICRAFGFHWKQFNDKRPKEALADELFAVTKIALSGK